MVKHLNSPVARPTCIANGVWQNGRITEASLLALNLG